jgi:protocatechuate 3,4-dioxygenase beta subunit
MTGHLVHTNRRAFLGALGTAFFTTPGLFADQLFPTPSLTEGPFYPDKLPLDTDNDLIIVNNSLTPALGEITHLTGRVLTTNGSPVNNAVVEIWQCDANMVYLHSSDSGPKEKQRDKNFQGFGKFTTNTKGEYRFRTIKPVPYPGRPSPHIHFKVKKGDRTLLTSQFFIRNHPGNDRDGIAKVGNVIDRELMMVDFKAIKDSKMGEYSAYFEIVLGRTPDDADTEPKKNRKQ